MGPTGCFCLYQLETGAQARVTPATRGLQKKPRLGFYLRQPAGTLRVGPPAPPSIFHWMKNRLTRCAQL